jgi:hypothetical protein
MEMGSSVRETEKTPILLIVYAENFDCGVREGTSGGVFGYGLPLAAKRLDNARTFFRETKGVHNVRRGKCRKFTTLRLHRVVGWFEIGVLMCLQIEAKHRGRKDGW